MPSGRIPYPRSRPIGTRTALQPADDKARLMMSFNAEFRGKRPALRRRERGCRSYLYIYIYISNHIYMIRCRPTDVGDSDFQIEMCWLIIF